MGDIVLGVGTSHTSQISVPWSEWPTLGRTQEPSPHIPEDFVAQLQPELFQRRHSAARTAVKQLGQVLKNADLDAIVYIPGYRTLPSTGCAMAFAYWN